MLASRLVKLYFLILLTSQSLIIISSAQNYQSTFTFKNSDIEIISSIGDSSEKNDGNFKNSNHNLIASKYSVAVPTPNIVNSSDAYQGYNVFQLRGGSESIFIVTDMDGNVISQVDTPGVGLGYIEFINSTLLLIYEGAGFYLWNYVTNYLEYLPLSSHHDAAYNGANDTIMAINGYIRSIDGVNYGFDYIREFDLNANILWEIDLFDYISPSIWSGETEGSYRDLCHTNSVFWDVNGDSVYVNLRNPNTFYKFDYRTKNLVWALGQHGNFTLYDINGKNRNNLFSHSHGLEMVDENTFILFDNDYFNGSSSNSRIMEITVDEDSMTANTTWEWNGYDPYYSIVWGDADRLPNGNRLGTFGYTSHPSSSYGARLVEVTPNSEIAWEMDFPGGYGVYKTERFTLTPTLSSPDDFITFSGISSVISWNAWYNFRTIDTKEGVYKIYVDDVEVALSNFSYERFWRPKEINYSLPILSPGIHNITLQIANEEGITQSDSVMVTITESTELIFENIILNNSVFELNNPDSLVKWSGYFSDVMSFNFTVNGILYNSGIWANTFEFNLNDLSPGDYLLELEIYNDTNVIDYKILNISLESPSVPVFSLKPINNTVFFNDQYTLNWSIFDLSPTSWFIRINGSQILSGNSIQNETEISYDLLGFNEGFYIFQLEVIDALGLISVNTVEIKVFPPLKPIILPLTVSNQFYWNQSNSLLQWDIHGGSIWKLYKNGVEVDEGILESNKLDYLLFDSPELRWLPGIYNITLEITSKTGVKEFLSMDIEIIFKFGDPFANEVISKQSAWSDSREYALGAPDNIYANIFVDYGSGYITLDMGLDEEILNLNGNDFTVIAIGGTYKVWVSNNLDEAFQLIGTATGTSDFDLGSIQIARYVKIEYLNGDTIELDAVEAINYNKIVEDVTPPKVIGPDDFWVYQNDATIKIIWLVSDILPWNYSIYVDNLIVESGSWSEGSLEFSTTLEGLGQHKITLLLNDALYNTAIDFVFVEVKDLPSTSHSSMITTSPTSNSTSENAPNFLILFSTLTLICISITRKMQK